jgi:hypothetical protein
MNATTHERKPHEREFATAMLAWLDARFGARLGVTFEMDTPLFGRGLIDSMRVLELIAWTERAIGRPVPDRMIRMDHFRTVRTIAATFARPDGPGEPDEREAA